MDKYWDHLPQGSNLEPHLCILFINDLIHIANFNKLLFANDFEMHSEVTTIADCLCVRRKIERKFVGQN